MANHGCGCCWHQHQLQQLLLLQVDLKPLTHARCSSAAQHAAPMRQQQKVPLHQLLQPSHKSSSC